MSPFLGLGPKAASQTVSVFALAREVPSSRTTDTHPRVSRVVTQAGALEGNMPGPHRSDREVWVWEVWADAESAKFRAWKTHAAQGRGKPGGIIGVWEGSTRVTWSLGASGWLPDRVASL